MITLPVAAVLSIAAACAPSVDSHMLAGIAQHESGLRPFAIHDNTAGNSIFPDNKVEAIAAAESLISQGHSLDLGLMQINTGNLRLLGLTVPAAFDPCRSIAAGASLLASFSRYNTGSPTRGIANGYAQSVTAAVRAVKGTALAAPDVVSPPTEELYPTPASGRELDYN
jgi:type IV secretion system protein VirB1